MTQIFRDFFLLIYNEERELVDSDKLALFVKRLGVEGIDLYAILLSCNERNFEIFSRIDFLRELYISLFDTMEASHGFFEPGKEMSLDGIKLLQLATLELLDSFPSSRIFHEILERVSRLKREGILLFEEEQRIRAVLHQLLSHHDERHTQSENVESEVDSEVFHDGFLQVGISRIEHAIEAIAELESSLKYGEKFKEIVNKLVEQKFSIGVTGVMNAGKSTMLNAILQREILGTNVIPETANLTILRYSEREYAVVHFWSAREWESIARSAQFDEGIDYFVKESIATFGTTLARYISDDSQSHEISIDELPTYTSAKHPSKLCNLVRSVEIFTPLEFLGEGVEIVDTPGLDDPLTQREEITKRYVIGCDVMLHLMNAAQSATQKDVDFIIDALVYQNVSRLLVILTRADTLSKDELASAMHYTTDSIRERLRVCNQKVNFSEIVERLEFIPIASKLALLHRTGRAEEALERGYELEDTGILRVESYLRDMLFGKNAKKTKTMLYGACRELLGVFDEILRELSLKKELASESIDRLSARLSELERTRVQTLIDMEKIRDSLGAQRDGISSYLDSLATSVGFKLIEVRNVLQERVLDDIRYEVSRGKKPTAARLENMIELGIQDALVDIARDYRHKFGKKLHFLMQEIESEFEKLSYLFAPQFLDELMQEFNGILVDETKGGRLIDNNSILKKSVVGIVNGGSKDIEAELRKVFAFSFDSLVELARARTDELGGELLMRFDTVTGRVYEYASAVLSQQESVLAMEIKMREGSTEIREKQEKELLLEESKISSAKDEIEKLLKEIA